MKSVPGGFSQPSGVHFPYGSQLWLEGWPDPPQRYLPGSLTIKSWLGLESSPCSPSGQAKCPSCWAPVLVYFSTASLSRVWEPAGLWCAVASSTSSHSNPPTSLHMSCCNRLVSHHQTHPPCNSFLLALVVVGHVYISLIFCIWYKLKKNGQWESRFPLLISSNYLVPFPRGKHCDQLLVSSSSREILSIYKTVHIGFLFLGRFHFLIPVQRSEGSCQDFGEERHQ